MLKTLRVCLALLLLIALFGCDNNDRKAAEYHHSSLHFGTLIDITLYGVSTEKAQQVFNKLDEDFAYFHTNWSPWEAGSLRRTNGLLKTGATFSAGPSVLSLIKKSTELSAKTDHLFNPAIGQLINLWQFHRADEETIRPPEDSAIQALLKQNPQLSDIEIQGIKIRSRNPAVQLNFGAFAKGYAIDLEIQLLKSLGIENAIINAGGDLKTLGSHGDRPWRIAIQHPRQDTWLAQLETRNEESLFTSGDYERYYLYQGRRYHHILDPRTGYPARGSQSVTVLHTDSGLADAAATALFIAGPDHWMEIARKLGLKEVMLIDASGTVYVTPEMRQRLRFNPQIQTTIIVTAAL